MKVYPVLLFSLVLAGCSANIVRTVPVLELGEATEASLTQRYNDTRVNCGASSQPAFLCSGVIMRGTNFSTTYHSWDNSLNSHQSGGVSFSYLRKDSRYRKLAYGYDNGYLFLPVLYAGNKLTPEILCAFPIDAFTVERDSKGCGSSPGFDQSGPCQDQNIHTPDAWYSHYQAGAHNRQHQCGFDVRDSLNADATIAFDAAIKAMALLGSESFNTQNEIRLAVWPDGSGQVLPLEAFFYVNDSAAGRKDAQDDQLDFKNTTGLTVPVISLHLPNTTAEHATFKYLVSDQIIPVP
jgi:hypothetical protein